MIQKEKEEGPLLHQEESPTAANAYNPLFGPSGVQPYRVLLAVQGGGRRATTVDAATGDEAALAALAKYPGWKVAYVGPASGTEAPRLADEAE